MYASLCSNRFPFDDQLCFLKFGSWTYDSTQVILTNRSENVDMLNYVDNGKFHWNNLLSTEFTRSTFARRMEIIIIMDYSISINISMLWWVVFRFEILFPYTTSNIILYVQCHYTLYHVVDSHMFNVLFTDRVRWKSIFRTNRSSGLFGFHVIDCWIDASDQWIHSSNQ